MEQFKDHELASLIPQMTEEEYEQLKEDIRENGQHEPITTYQGQILDGRHRYRACLELGIPPIATEYTGDDPAKYVVSLNVHRRHLTAGQKGAIYVQVKPYYEARAKERQHEGGEQGRASRDGSGLAPVGAKPEESHKKASEEAASDIGVGARTAERVARIADKDEELFKEVASGTKTAWAAENEMTQRNKEESPRPKAKPGPRIYPETAKRRLADVMATLKGYCKGLEDFDVPRAKEGASPQEIDDWEKTLDEAIRAFRKLRTTIKEN